MSNLYQGRCSSPLHIYYLSSTGHDHKKKNHSKKKIKKNCDISNLCIELVVKEMSQRDLWSRGAAALLRECYPATGGVLCPPLGLCGQTWRCTSTKLSNMGRHSQQPWMLVDLWSKSITISCSHRSKRQPGSHILSTSTWQIHSQSMPMWSTILLPISKRLSSLHSSLESSKSTHSNLLDFRETQWWNWWKVPEPIVDER